jgi:hypothetical protein
VFEAPRHPINIQLRGVRLRRNPHKALDMLSVKILVEPLDNLQWRRVAEGLSQFTSNLVLRREVHLLEQLG